MQHGPRGGALESRRPFEVAKRPIAEPERQIVHRPAWWNTDVPQPHPARQILNRRQQAGTLNGDSRPGIGDSGKGRRTVASRSHVGMVDGRAEQPGVDLDALQHSGIQRAAEPVEGLVSMLTHGDHLGEQGVVGRRHLGARLHPGVDTHVLLVRKIHGRQRSRARAVVPRRVLRIHARLNGVPPNRHLTGGSARRQMGVEHVSVTAREPKHPAGQVDSGHRLGHRMLDLQPRVDLEERGLASAWVVDELNSARRAVGDRFRQRPRCRMQLRPNGIGQVRRGRLFDHLLVAALQRTVTVAERYDAAGTVAEDLNLHMSGVFDVTLDEYACRSETALGHPRYAVERGTKIVGVPAHLHTDATTAARRLEHHGIADRGGGGHRVRCTVE